MGRNKYQDIHEKPKNVLAHPISPENKPPTPEEWLLQQAELQKAIALKQMESASTTVIHRPGEQLRYKRLKARLGAAGTAGIQKAWLDPQIIRQSSNKVLSDLTAVHALRSTIDRQHGQEKAFIDPTTGKVRVKLKDGETELAFPPSESPESPPGNTESE